MSGLFIKELEPQHVDSACAIERQCLKEGWSRDSIAAFIGRDDAVYLVCLDGKQVCGIAGMYITAGEGQIINIAVPPEQRRRGIGKMLLKQLLEEGIKRGATAFILEVDSKNSPAISLYSSFGFTEAGRRKGLSGDSRSLIMRLGSSID